MHQSTLSVIGGSAHISDEALKNCLDDLSSFSNLVLPRALRSAPANRAVTLLSAHQCDFVTSVYAQYAAQMQLTSTSPTTVDPPTPQPQPAPTSSPKVVPNQTAASWHLGPFVASCCVCKEEFGPQTDAETHFQSKDHQWRLFELEQCAVIVTGVPDEAAMAIIEALFQDFTLQPGSATFIPALTDPQSQEGLAKVLEQYRPISEYWHVVLSSPEEAQQAAQIGDVTFLNHRLRVQLAVQPQHCLTCDVTVQSTPQLEDHRRTHRHQELFRQHAARCGLSLVGLPLAVTRRELAGLLDACEVIEGGYTTEVVTKKDGSRSQTVHLVFSSETDAEAAYDICKAGHPMLGEQVRLLRPCGPKREEAEAAKLKLKKVNEVHQFVSGLLRTHHIKDINAVSPSLFIRIYNAYVFARPAVLPSLSPQNRFLQEFDALGSKGGIISLDSALAILQPLGPEFSFTLPESIAMWLCERVMRYSGNSQMVPITRSTFTRIRDLVHFTYHTCDRVIRIIQANLAEAETQMAPSTTFTNGTAPGSRWGNAPHGKRDGVWCRWGH